jgi:lipopolysaccharide assembly outer membrane protein LptD (OstA)
MNKKIVVQIILFLSLLIISFFFYYKYFFLEKKIVKLTNKSINVLVSKNNLIKDLEYLSTDKNGNKYLITAKYGEISSTENSVILMTNVVAQIDLVRRDKVYLTADTAKYNTLTLDTNFSQNVILKYTGHEINSKNIDLSFKKNFVWVYNDIVYISPTNELFADKLEIDLLTKNSKIFMYGDKKLKLIGK